MGLESATRDFLREKGTMGSQSPCLGQSQNASGVAFCETCGSRQISIEERRLEPVLKCEIRVEPRRDPLRRVVLGVDCGVFDVHANAKMRNDAKVEGASDV